LLTRDLLCGFREHLGRDVGSARARVARRFAAAPKRTVTVADCLTNRLTRQANLASGKLRQNHKSAANQCLAEPLEASHKPTGPEPEGRRGGAL
jgi:hypothetical protein